MLRKLSLDRYHCINFTIFSLYVTYFEDLFTNVIIQRNLSKPNLFGIHFSVQNRQMLNQQTFPTLGLYLMFSFYRILVIQGSNFETVIISHTIQLSPTSKVRVVVFNATFNNISVISWRPVLLVEETGVLYLEKTTT